MVAARSRRNRTFTISIIPPGSDDEMVGLDRHDHRGTVHHSERVADFDPIHRRRGQRGRGVTGGIRPTDRMTRVTTAPQIPLVAQRRATTGNTHRGTLTRTDQRCLRLHLHRGHDSRRERIIRETRHPVCPHPQEVWRARYQPRDHLTRQIAHIGGGHADDEISRRRNLKLISRSMSQSIPVGCKSCGGDPRRWL